jgi:hypothetical protein
MEMKLVSCGPYTAAWMDSNLHDFLAVFQAFPSMQFALISCLDSNRNVRDLLEDSPELEPTIKCHTRVIGQSLVVPTKQLLDADRSQRLLFGFDEVWFFPNEDVTPLPAGTGIVGPRRISQERINALGKWMKANSCSLGLGDGDGINIVSKASGLVKYILGSSIYQSVPASAT